MKLGTCIFLLVIILIAFGYVMSDDQHIRRDLKDASLQLEGLNTQVLEVNEQLNACRKTVQDDQQIISQQRTEITSLNNMISVKEDEIVSLKTIVSQQTSRISELEGHLARSAEEKASGPSVQSVSAGLQLDPRILVVISIVQLGLFILQRRQKNGYVRLSEEERAEIIKMRRMKNL